MKILFILLALTMAYINVFAQVAVNTYGNGDSYSMSGAETVFDPAWGTSAHATAVSFRALYGGKVQTLTVPVSRGGGLSSTVPRTISLRSDINGYPGGVLESWTFVPTISPSNYTFYGTKSQLSVSNAYWVSLDMNATNTLSTRDNWFFAPSGTPQSYMARQSVVDGPWTKYLTLPQACRIIVGTNYITKPTAPSAPVEWLDNLTNTTYQFGVHTNGTVVWRKKL